MNNANKILEIDEVVKESDIANSRYEIHYSILCSGTNNRGNYTYVLEYNKGICKFTKDYLNGKSNRVKPDNLLNDYKQINHIPSLWNEFLECYINSHKRRNKKILPLIKQIITKSDNKPDLKDRQEVFSEFELNEKLKNIELPKKEGDFYIQPINYNGHFSNIIISNEKNTKKYYLYDSYIGNHRTNKHILNSRIFDKSLNIEVFPIENLQKETNTCGFFCMSFALEAAKCENIDQLKEKINNKEMQATITKNVLTLVGKNKILQAQNKRGEKGREELHKRIGTGQGFEANYEQQENLTQPSWAKAFKGCSMDDNIVKLKSKSHVEDLELRRNHSSTHSISRSNSQ